jgi:hypothetical protein
VVEKRGGTVLVRPTEMIDMTKINEIERGCPGSSRAQALELKISAL